MRNYKNARGEGCVFNVELTDEEVRKLSLFLIDSLCGMVTHNCLLCCGSGNTNSSYDVQ